MFELFTFSKDQVFQTVFRGLLYKSLLVLVQLPPHNLDLNESTLQIQRLHFSHQLRRQLILQGFTFNLFGLHQ